MAFQQNLTPFSWNPNTRSNPGSSIPGTPIRGGGNVDAGDWCMVSLSYPTTNNRPVAYAPGYFLVHVLYTPDSDDSTPHEDMAVTYGGTVANRKRTYRIDPGLWFQVPTRGQLSIIAGGDSDPSVVLNVVLSKIHTPRDDEALDAKIRALRERANVPPDPFAYLMNEEDIGTDALVALSTMNPAMPPTPPRKYPPPVVGTPQRVHATWVNIPAATPIDLPDGAEQILTVLPSGGGLTVAPVIFTVNTMGVVLQLDVQSGLPFPVGAMAQGFAGSDGIRATWQVAGAALSSVVVFSSLGG